MVKISLTDSFDLVKHTSHKETNKRINSFFKFWKKIFILQCKARVLISYYIHAIATTFINIDNLLLVNNKINNTKVGFIKCNFMGQPLRILIFSLCVLFSYLTHLSQIDTEEEKIQIVWISWRTWPWICPSSWEPDRL